jgi:hypothetical protein
MISTLVCAVSKLPIRNAAAVVEAEKAESLSWS